MATPTGQRWPLPSRERAMRVDIIKGLRARLPLYAEYRWQVRAWCAKKRGRASDGPIVA